MVEGAVSDLQDDQIIVDVHIAEDHAISVGDTVTVTAPGGGTTQLEVAGIADDPNVLGVLALTREAFRAISPQQSDLQVAGTIEPGADLDTVLAELRVALEDEPEIQVLDRDGFIGSIVDQITSYITIDLRPAGAVDHHCARRHREHAVAVHHRADRELGLLRAIGMDRAGVRSAVRWEASLISSLGALVGVSVGILLSVALVKAMQGFGLASFAFPGAGLGVVIVVTVALGTLAAVRPARRAAGLSILDAIATE